MKLDEFAWTQDGHEDEPGTLHTDIRITQNADGTYEAQTLIEPSQKVKFQNIEELVPAFESMLHQRATKTQTSQR